MAESRVVIVTGMSGAGRSTAANVLEDLGYFVIDNLPPAFILDVVDRAGAPDAPADRVAVVVDARGGLTARDLEAVLNGLAGRGMPSTVLFLDADDQMLIDRFAETRRTHPVQQGTLAEKITIERRRLEEIRGQADVILDTTRLNVHELRRRLEEAFAADLSQRRMRIDVTSFGFKRGVPRVVDLLFDVRFLPNPHWVPELKERTGRDGPVRDYVLEQEGTAAFMDRVIDMLVFLVPRYEAEGKAYLTIGVGCTGGRHRSVVIAEEIGRRLATRDGDVSVRHRDVPEEDL